MYKLPISNVSLESQIQRERQQAEDVIKEDNYLEKEIDSGRESVSSNGDEMGETVDTADEYALEPADSKKASAFNSMPENVKLEMKIEEMEENRVNDIYFTSKRVFLEFFR